MLRRPEPGAPFDKRMNAETLTALLSAGPRPFDSSRDVDLFDAIEAYLRETLLSPAALSPYTYAAAQYAVNEPETGWTIQGTPLSGPRSLLSAFPATNYAGKIGYRYGAPVDGLPAAGSVHTLPVDLPGAAHVARVSLLFMLGAAGYVAPDGSVELAPCADTRYDVALIGPDGATVAEALDVSPRDARILSQRTLTVYRSNGTPAQLDVPAVAAVDLPVGRVLPGGAYGVRWTLRTVRPRRNVSEFQSVDTNAYPVADGGGSTIAALTPSPAWPDGRRSTGAVVWDLDLTVPATSSMTEHAATFSGAQLIRTATPLGPSGTLASRWVLEFSLDDTPDVRAWGGQLSFLPTFYPDARLHDELPYLLGITGGMGERSETVYSASLNPIDLALTLVHPPRRDDNLWTYGVRGGGERYRLEVTRRDIEIVTTAGTLTTRARGWSWDYRLYNAAGELLQAQERRVAGGAGDLSSWRMAILTHPGNAGWLLGKPAPLTVHRWQEWRE